MKPDQLETPNHRRRDGLVPLESILCTEELNRRTSRSPDYEKENRALATLSQALADSPGTILQSLADTILEVFECDSAGLSLVTADESRFYWPAISGAWRPHVGGGTPRDFGPCGDVLDRNAPLLFKHFERRYRYLLEATPLAEEALLIPFYVNGRAVGTIWAMAHDDRRRFDSEDLRQLESLGRFASASYQVLELKQLDDSRRAALNLMEDAVQARHAMERVNRLLQLQRDTLEMLVQGTPLPQVLEALARAMERESQHKIMAAIHLLDETGSRFALGIAPSLPKTYRGATEGMDVDTTTSPCCVAVLTRESVTVRDIDSDPQWRAFAEFAAPLGIRAGWSTPIVSSGGDIVGTFANYYDEPREPGALDIGVVDMLARTAALAIERKQAESERERLLESEQQARREADLANRMKDEFLATVSHELRTPLNAITGWTHMLIRGKLDEETSARGLKTIARNANAQTQLIADLLDVSRIVSGQIHFEGGVVDLIPVIEAATETVRPAADAKGVILQLKLDSTAGMVSGDSTRLQQIVWNLLSNAVKFTSRGGHVEVRLKRQDNSVAIIVNDTGEGINPEFLPYIFDRFRQAESTTKRQHGGLGLGLSIVRHLVEAHGGTIRASSKGLGKGASFTVTLPLIAVSQDGVDRAGAGTGFDQASSTILKGLRVLVIDDEPDARELLTMALTQSGAEVKAADTVRAGLALLERWKPNVLVSDIGMPGEDGYDLIRRVRALKSERGGRIPALALTGYASPEDAIRARNAGYQTHMAKPVAPSVLVAAVANLAAGSSPNVKSNTDSIG